MWARSKARSRRFGPCQVRRDAQAGLSASTRLRRSATLAVPWLSRASRLPEGAGRPAELAAERAADVLRQREAREPADLENPMPVRLREISDALAQRAPVPARRITFFCLNRGRGNATMWAL